MHVKAQRGNLGQKPDITDGVLTLLLVLPTEVVKSTPDQLISFEKLVLLPGRGVNMWHSWDKSV